MEKPNWKVVSKKNKKTNSPFQFPTTLFQAVFDYLQGPYKMIPTKIMFVENGDLVGGFNPFEKDARQIGSSPQVRLKIKNV